jgi:RepB DNA-primase from phage plasmid
MERNIASKYIKDNFKPSDRLAVVLLDKRNDAVIQRIATAEQIAAPEFQAWLRHKNAQRYEVYVSMNTLRPGATGRTKGDIATVRHLYLDFDENGTEAVERLLRRQELPRPTYRMSSSPGKWQVVWKVEGFAPEQAERLQQWMAKDTGADPAATDSARVLRLPGFYNHKYEKPHFVSV